MSIKGRFEVNENIVAQFDGDVDKMADFYISKLLNNTEHNIKQFVRRTNILNNNTEYLFFTNPNEEIKYSRFYFDEGYEVNYYYIKNK